MGIMVNCRLYAGDQLDDSVPVHYSRVVCDGTETVLAECENTLFLTTNFNHSSDVYIVCLPRTRYTGIVISLFGRRGGREGEEEGRRGGGKERRREGEEEGRRGGGKERRREGGEVVGRRKRRKERGREGGEFFDYIFVGLIFSNSMLFIFVGTVGMGCPGIESFQKYCRDY